MTTGDPTLNNVLNDLSNVPLASPTFTGWSDDVYAIERDLGDIEKRLTEIEKRLLILIPDVKLMEKYPSLKEAYEAYKIIEQLLGGNDDKIEK